MTPATLGHALAVLIAPGDTRDRNRVLDVVGEIGVNYPDLMGRPVSVSMFTDPEFLDLLSDYGEGDAKLATAMGLYIRRAVDIVEAAEDREDGLPPAPERGATYRAVDMSTVDQITLETTILARIDNICLMYRGRIHWFQGESESGKTWLMLIAVAQQLLAGFAVIYLDYEDHPAAVKGRLLALGVPADIINNPTRFAYMRPDEPLTTEAIVILMAEMDRLRPTLVVIDGVSESMALDGYDPISTPDSATWIAQLPKRLASHPSEPAVGVIDHVTKSREGRGGYAFGSQHKKAGVDGAAYEVVSIHKIHRAFGGDPVEGLISVKVSKDRPGFIRGHALGDNAAALKLTAWPDGGITYEVTTDAIAQDYGLRERVARYLAASEGSGKRELRDAGGKGELIDQAIAAMAMEGHIEVRREGQKHAHYLTDVGRKAYGLEENL